MQFQFEVKIGRQKFTFVENATTHKEFFEKVSFYSGLPQVGPNGEEDLEIVFRTTKQGHTYYSIVCESAKKEYKFGQSQQKPGELFGKGWEDAYDPTAAENGQSQAVQTGAGLGAPAGQQYQTPAPAAAPQQYAAPAQQGLGAPAAPTAPAQQQTTPAPTGASPTVQGQANDVLSKFLGQ